MTKDELSYKTKYISYKGKESVILLQDVNGPCPILAIANVLLLNDRLKLPPGVDEVSEERLVQLVAGYLLDYNSLAGRQDVSEEYKLNLQHNVQDAISLLPKLTTGIDVNIRFHDIRGFEYTNEVAVFDLLDIQLLHGWLCDPQDEATSCALGRKSYNELIIQMISTLGGAATPPRGTPSSSFKRQHSAGAAAPAGTSGADQSRHGTDPHMSSPPAQPEEGGPAAGSVESQDRALVAGAEVPLREGGGAVGPAVAGSTAGISTGQQPVDAQALAAALHTSLHISTHPPTAAGAASGPATDAGAAGAAVAAPSSPGAGRGGSAQQAEQAVTPQASAALSGGTSTMTASTTGGTGSIWEGDSMRTVLDDMLAGLVQDAFSPTPDRQPSSAPSSARAASSLSTVSPPPPASPSTAPSAAPEDGTLASMTPPASAAADLPGGLGTAVPEEEAPAPTAPPPGTFDGVAQGEGGGVGEPSRDTLTPQLSRLATSRSLAGEESVALILRYLPGGLEGSREGGAPEVDEAVEVELLIQRTSSFPQLPMSPFQSVTSSELCRTRSGLSATGSDAAGAAGPCSRSGSELGSRQGSQVQGGGSTSAQAPPGAAVPDEGAVHDALLVQQFLEGTPSQLTWHGLHALHDGMREGQLAVFFRNNHFNTLLKGEGGLYILVTDQGYQFESDVVWEHLAAVDGDTQFVDSRLRPFRAHAAQYGGHPSSLPTLDQSLGPGGSRGGTALDAAGAAGNGAGTPRHEDADLALAMALQQEEHDRMDREAQRAQQAQAQQQRAQQAQAQERAQQQQAQQRQGAGGAGSSGGGMKKMKKKVKEECVVM